MSNQETYAVTRRAFEIGLRVTLGATRASVVRLILVNATRVVAAGSAIGMLVSLTGLQALRPLLAVGQRTIDPLAIAGVAVILIGAGAAAILWPAKRAATFDPAVTLKAE